MRLLVTGAGGLVGHAVQAVLRECCPDMEAVCWLASSAQVDLRDWEATLTAFEAFRPTHVLHLAARVGGLFANMRLPADFYEDNVLMNLHVLRAARRTGCVKVASCLSTCIFPDGVPLPLTEADVHAGPPHESNFAYAYAKRMQEVHGRALRRQHGLTCVTLIPTNVYGPHDNFREDTSHVVPALVRRAVQAAADGEPLVVKGSGAPLRQFIFAEDLARLLLWAVQHYDEEEPLLLCPDEQDEVSIAQVAGEVAAAAGVQHPQPLVFDTACADGQARKTASNAKLRRLLPDFRFTPLRAGLQRTVQWYKDALTRSKIIADTPLRL